MRLERAAALVQVLLNEISIGGEALSAQAVAQRRATATEILEQVGIAVAVFHGTNHELQLVNASWRDLDHLENADKCAWVTVGPGKMANVSFPTGTFPVQGTWSNAALGGLGACSTDGT